MSECTLRNQIAALTVMDDSDTADGWNAAIERVLRILAAHTAAQPAPDAVAEADLTEEQRAEIVDAAHLAFHRSQQGIQGQVITEWHGIESHVVVETQRYLRNLAKGQQL